MPHLLLSMKWSNYVGAPGAWALFEADPLAYNSNQERLHLAQPGDRVWIVAGKPKTGEYHLVAKLTVARQEFNAPTSAEGEHFGRYRLVMDRDASRDLGETVPANQLVRSLEFDPPNPIKPGANLSASLLTIRVLSPGDDQHLLAAIR